MRKAAALILWSIGGWLSSTALADGFGILASMDETNWTRPGATGSFIAEGESVSGSAPTQSPWGMELSDIQTRPRFDIAFDNTSALRRISRIRNLSILTLAKKGQSRVFLGVDDDGLVGLHITIFPGHRDDRVLELIRMPYLEEERIPTLR